MNPQPKVRPWLWVALAIVVAGGIGFLGWYYFYQGKNLQPGSFKSPKTTSSVPKGQPPTDYQALNTSSGKDVYLKLMNLSDNQWQQVSYQRNNSILAKIAQAAEETKALIIDFSRNFSSQDSFLALASQDKKDWILGGGTNKAVNLYLTDFSSKINDLSGQLPKINQNSVINTMDADGKIWLLGVSNTSGEKAQLVKYDGQKFEDISSNLNLVVENATTNGRFASPVPPENLTAINVIKSNGQSWLIAAGGNSKNSNKIFQSDGTNYEDISNLFPEGKRNIQAAEWNGQYWLLGGKYYTGSPSEWAPTLYKYQNGQVEDLSSNVPAKGVHATQISAISWNGKAFLIGGDDQGRPGQQSTYGGLLYLYDGTSFTNLSDEIEIQYITRIGSNGSDWLIGGYNWTIYRYDGKTFDRVPINGINNSQNNVVKSIAWDGQDYILGGYQSLILKIRFIK